MGIAILGILLAYAIYGLKWISAESLGKAFKPFYSLFSHKYWLDELYEKVIVVKVLMNGIFSACNFFDSRVVDGAVNGLANGTVVASKTIRRAQTGQLQLYAMTIAIGIIAILVCVYIFG